VTFGYLGKIPYRAAIKARLEQIVNYPRYGRAFHKAGYVFFSKNDGLQNQSVLYVQKGLDGAPEVLLDPNTFSADGTVQLAGFWVSRNGKYAAYAVSRGGSDWREMRVMEIATRRTLPETLEWVKFSGASWRGDEGFYYSRYPRPAPGTERTAKNENQKVYFHRVGTPQAEDALVYEDPTYPDRSVGSALTDDEAYEILYTREPGKRGNALFYRAVGQGDKAFTPIVGRDRR
jgi:prolyl oligopeptidase